MELSRDGPGLLLRDLLKGDDPQVSAVVHVIRQVSPDIIVLTDFDYDHEQIALTVFRDQLAEAGVDFPYWFSELTNGGMATGRDLDGDGRLGGARDAQGYGWFAGDQGIAVMSRYPIRTQEVQNYSALLWKDLPGANLTATEASEIGDIQRLSSTVHWVVPIEAGQQTVELLVFSATPPVFDGPDDRNGRRNMDELRLWSLYLDGALGAYSGGLFIIAGNMNIDPQKGEGRKQGIKAMLADQRVQDPRPASNAHGVDTADWDDPVPGDMRVDYVLPSSQFKVTNAGVYWPDDDPRISAASRHRLVWVDVTLP